MWDLPLASGQTVDDMQLVTYLGFEYEGPGLGEMFSALSADDIKDLKEDLELLIYHKWSV